MSFKPRRPFSLTLCLGFLFLAVANITKFVLERHTSMAEGPRDGLSGFLFGVAIATLCLGIWRMQRRIAEKSRCARSSQ
jgi:hypothetical protein